MLLQLALKETKEVDPISFISPFNHGFVDNEWEQLYIRKTKLLLCYFIGSINIRGNKIH